MSKTTEMININIVDNHKEGIIDANDISDGYHTFGELYKHRIHLFIALCKTIEKHAVYPECIPAPQQLCTKSKLHDDWSEFEGWFIIQLDSLAGQISYHLPNEYWYKCDFAETLDRANKWDWHTSDDVLERLLKL